ncbi:MAG: FprA family A-type flavoprotein [Candidatus Omnitrophica bacterium]|nr:FprA family A-type flavoprotein [Candidatus Omnitrophota bacterium]MDD5574080.1 FprA family A-type flavoprotein [Candidatus Omnitrophota bacterium]
MTKTELKNGIYWVGAVDGNVRDFHGYRTRLGTSYNAYLIVDDKLTLVDTVKKGFGPDLLRHVAGIADPSKIENLIVNHVEMDHSGAIPEVCAAAPRARIYCTSRGREGLIKHYGMKDREFCVVKTGDKLSLGKKTLTFVTAPMVHWPDSMFTYCVEDRILLPNDAFGQHVGHPLRFADEIGEDLCLEEAAKYYANILMPLGGVISKKIEEFRAMDLPVEMIAPSHGAIWRKDPLRIVEAYARWTAQETVPKVVIVYDTMWESTDKLARRLVECLASPGLEVKLYHLRKSDNSQIVRDILDARVLLFGSPTLNSDMFWTMGGFLTYLRGLKPKNKKVGIFGSYGWAEGASRAIRRDIEAMDLEMIEPPFEVQYIPSEEELSRLADYAKVITRAAKEPATK